MSPAEIPEARWNGYAIRPRKTGGLVEHDDGTLEIGAERDYLVELPSGARERAWRALEPLTPGLALLRFGNFVGESTLGGRRLLVTSNRLEPAEVEHMLDEVVAALHSLPFSFETPTRLAYERDVAAWEDVDYQAYAFVAHSLRGIGPHDLPAAFDRILARPHMRLVATAAEVPLARADRVDAETIVSLGQGRSPLHPVRPHTALAASPVAVALRGRVPETVRAGRMVETRDTAENRFVVAVLRAARRIVDRFEEAVLRDYPPLAERHLRESRELSALLDRWRRHPALTDVAPARRMQTQSTVLRGRPGYREVTRFFVDLQARTRLLDADDAQRLLEARDAALIYEYWCFFQVVKAVRAVLGREPNVTPFRYRSFGSHVPHAYSAEFGPARVSFNLEFRPPRSYSVRLRPDIALELPDGTLHLFDAKLKREEPIAAAADDDDADLDAEERRATYRRGDLYKMHTYRDALNARSVWILFPGRQVLTVAFRPEPAGGPEASDPAPSGVGAIPLLPGSAAHRAGLTGIVRTTLEGGSVAQP